MIAAAVGAGELAILVPWFLRLARDLGAGLPPLASRLGLPGWIPPDGLDVLAEAEDLARWAGASPVRSIDERRFEALATAMAGDAAATWRVACNAVRAVRGERVERWTAELPSG